MRREKAIWIVFYVLCVMFTWPGDVARAQEGGGVDLRIRLRASDGSAVVDEPVVLQRLPDEEDIAPACRTDTEGICTWRVRRGLYQLLFDRPLDAVSALAVAEGGLRGLGVTVGDATITYHFTFHSDGRVYFDAAPEAAVPVPIIPESDELHGGVEPFRRTAAFDDDVTVLTWEELIDGDGLDPPLFAQQELCRIATDDGELASGVCEHLGNEQAEPSWSDNTDVHTLIDGALGQHLVCGGEGLDEDSFLVGYDIGQGVEVPQGDGDKVRQASVSVLDAKDRAFSAVTG